VSPLSPVRKLLRNVTGGKGRCQQGRGLRGLGFGAGGRIGGQNMSDNLTLPDVFISRHPRRFYACLASQSAAVVPQRRDGGRKATLVVLSPPRSSGPRPSESRAACPVTF
jgi:hypothetical protein